MAHGDCLFLDNMIIRYDIFLIRWSQTQETDSRQAPLTVHSILTIYDFLLETFDILHTILLLNK